LDTSPEPPADPSRLRACRLEQYEALSGMSEKTRGQDLRELRQLVAQVPLCGEVHGEVVDYLGRRGNNERTPKPGYSDREFGDLVKAARADVANIRDRIRRGEALLTDFKQTRIPLTARGASGEHGSTRRLVTGASRQAPARRRVPGGLISPGICS
jgi:hypothetical protein